MTDDFFRSRLDQMIDNSHPLAVLASRLPGEGMQAGVAPQFAHKERPLQQSEEAPDLAGPVVSVSGGKPSNAGRPRSCMRLMIALTLLKNSFDLSDEELMQRFAQNVYWQHFASFEYFDPRPPCDASQIGRFRTLLGEAGLEELLSATIHTAVDVGAIKKSEFKRVIVDTTVQEKAFHPSSGQPPVRDCPAQSGGGCQALRHRAQTNLCGRRQDLATSGGRLRPCQTVQAPQARGQTPAHDSWRFSFVRPNASCRRCRARPTTPWR